MQVVITGANRGLGLGLTQWALERGDEVIATARDVAAASALQALSRPRLRIEELDIGSDASVASFAHRLGEMSVDILINNAAVYGSTERFEAFALADALSTFDTNVLGAVRVTRALLPALRRGSTKKIVMISSRMGSIEDNTGGGSYPYRLSKAALNMLAKNLAVDLRSQGMIVVAMNPGWVRTDMGGSHAPTSVADSTTGIWRTIDALELKDSGAFVDYRGGAHVPW